MEGKTFEKSSPEQVEEMIELFKRGIGVTEISRKFHKDHSTIIYWLGKNGVYIYEKYYFSKKSNQKTPEEQKQIIKDWENGKVKKIREKEKVKRKEQRFLKTHCIICRKKKEKIWKKTQYCSRKCWNKVYEKKYPKPFTPQMDSQNIKKIGEDY